MFMHRSQVSIAFFSWPGFCGVYFTRDKVFPCSFSFIVDSFIGRSALVQYSPWVLASMFSSMRFDVVDDAVIVVLCC